MISAVESWGSWTRVRPWAFRGGTEVVTVVLMEAVRRTEKVPLVVVDAAVEDCPNSTVSEGRSGRSSEAKDDWVGQRRGSQLSAELALERGSIGVPVRSLGPLSDRSERNLLN
jgi:hypothetical protein